MNRVKLDLAVKDSQQQISMCIIIRIHLHYLDCVNNPTHLLYLRNLFLFSPFPVAIYGNIDFLFHFV